jgi:hypothetical protein
MHSAQLPSRSAVQALAFGLAHRALEQAAQGLEVSVEVSDLEWASGYLGKLDNSEAHWDHPDAS